MVDILFLAGFGEDGLDLLIDLGQVIGNALAKSMGFLTQIVVAEAVQPLVDVVDLVDDGTILRYVPFIFCAEYFLDPF